MVSRNMLMLFQITFLRLLAIWRWRVDVQAIWQQHMPHQVATHNNRQATPEWYDLRMQVCQLGSTYQPCCATCAAGGAWHLQIFTQQTKNTLPVMQPGRVNIRILEVGLTPVASS